LKDLRLELEKVQQGRDFAIDVASLFQQNIASLTSLGDLDTQKLKECEIKVLLAKNDEKRIAQKLEKVRAKCKATDERCVAFVFEANATKLSALDKEVMGLSQLISEMKNRGGPSLYPLPLLCNPSILEENFVELNMCPCYELCYNCHNYIFSNCGDSYHLWCLLEQSRVSSKCLVKDYEAE
jgi:hypothetical protein